MREELKTNWFNSDPGPVGDEAAQELSVTVTSGDDNDGHKFGNYQLFDISGYKWDDTNGDEVGVWDDGELGLVGWTIFIDDSNDGVLDWTDAGGMNEVWDSGEGEQWTTTNASGFYEFTDLTPGVDYRITEEQQNGWTNTFDGSIVITGVSGVDRSGTQGMAEVLNFGNFLPADPSGQSPGFWKNHIGIFDQELYQFDVGTTFGETAHSLRYETVFGVDLDDPEDGVGEEDGPTLEDALNTGGGGEGALLRHSTAALANAASELLNFSFAGFPDDDPVLATLILISPDDTVITVDELIAAVFDLYEDIGEIGPGDDHFDFEGAGNLADVNDLVDALAAMNSLPHLPADDFMVI